MRKIKLAVLISGRGSNMEALIKACADPEYPATMAVVISNRPDAPGIEKAKAAGIATDIVDHKKFSSRSEFETALQTALLKYAPVDLVCLAGFMRILTADFVNQWHNRMINIHPSLLPDYKGLDTYARALADGRTEAGCTVHYVVPEMDNGPTIIQKRVPILAGDTPETLATRILAQEHGAYTEAVRLVATRILG